MKLFDENQLILEPTERIGGLIPKNKLTLFTGLPGTGKTYSLIKFLNENQIEPIHINLDNSEIGSLKAYMFGEYVLSNLIELKYTDIQNQVIILDTYQRVADHFNIYTEQSKIKIVEQLEKMVKHYNSTIIVIGHPEDYVGKDSIFKANNYLVRNCYEHLHLEKQITSSTKNKITTKTTNYYLYVNKGRGYTGDRIIPNWMRD